MTQRRRTRGFRGTRRRTGRNVWVNNDVNAAPVNGVVGAVDLLVGALDFMRFDSTVQTIVIPNLNLAFDSLAPSGNRRIAINFQVGRDTLDPADFESPFLDNVGPPYMGVLSQTKRVSGVQVQNIPLIDPGKGISFDSKRRFRENNSTLWMVFMFLSVAADTSITLDGHVRTLLHIP